jgi:hypothetical protein
MGSEPLYAEGVEDVKVAGARTINRRISRKHLCSRSLVCVALTLSAAPALAQIDLSGTWTLQNQQDYQDSHFGNFPTDFLGIPINEDARAAGLGWEGNILEELQRQCEPWPEHYIVEYGGPTTIRGGLGHVPSGLRISSNNDPVTGIVQAWHISNSVDRMPLNIWMDGRPEPVPLALHTYGGFATGAWHGDTLTATVTHIKDGFLTRNGIPNSNRETLTLFISRHDNMLTITGILRDPVYLTDAYPLAQTYILDPSIPTDVPPTSCDPVETIPELSDGYHSTRVLPGESKTLHYMQEHYQIPLDAALGGAQTMYPEFQKKLKNEYIVPSKYCTQYCCGAMGGVSETSRTTKRYDHEVLQCAADGS